VTSKDLTQSNQDVLHESYRKWHYAPKQIEYAAIPYQSTNYPRTLSWGFLGRLGEGSFLQHLLFREVICRLRVGLSVLEFWLRLSRISESRPTCIFESVELWDREVSCLPGG
jgi:hypothetical protein